VLLYFGFICLKLFGHTRPFSLSVVLLAYTRFNLLAVWFRYGELFSVMFRLASLIAPIRYDAQTPGAGRFVLRMPFAGLAGARLEHFSLLIFLRFMLSSTAFDGLRETALWFNIFWKDPLHILEPLLGEHPIYDYVRLRPWYIGFEMLCLALSPCLYLHLFAGFLGLDNALTRSTHSISELLLRFGYTLLPIALVYHVTHYYTLLLNQGVKIRALVSDPFGWNWNLFGTALTGRIPILPDMGLIWYSQVGFILIGHIASVYLAHAQALRTYASPRQATLSQVPMLLLMVIFTGVGLWILAQPLQG
jgi:hypothetical protein